MGTPEWAIPSLQAVLDSGSEISAVFTQPDRPFGRKRVLTPSSIKQFSQTQKLPVHTPEKAGNPETLELVRSSPEVIAACTGEAPRNFGKKEKCRLKQSILGISKKECGKICP